MKRQASVVWEGGLSDGRGVITTESSTLGEGQDFGARSGDGEGTHAGLIAAAFAVCFAMDLTRRLSKTGLTPERIHAVVAILLEKQSPGWTIINGQLDVLAWVPGGRQGDFIQAARNAKDHCPISPLLKATLSMDARLIA